MAFPSHDMLLRQELPDYKILTPSTRFSCLFFIWPICIWPFFLKMVLTLYFYFLLFLGETEQTPMTWYIKLDSIDLKENWKVSLDAASLLRLEPAWSSQILSSLIRGPPCSLRGFQSQMHFPSSRRPQPKPESVLGSWVLCVWEGEMILRPPSMRLGPETSQTLKLWTTEQPRLAPRTAYHLFSQNTLMITSSLLEEARAREDDAGPTYHTHFPSRIQ